MGDDMELFKNAVVTQIYEPVTVSSRRGRMLTMEGRDCYGLSFCTCGQITYRMNGKEFVSRPGFAVILPFGGNYTLHGDADGLFPLIDFDCKGLEIREITILPLTKEAECIAGYERIKQDFLTGSHLRVYQNFYGLLELVMSQQKSKQDPMFRVLEYIESHYTEPALTNDRLAALIGVSEVYFRKLFLSYCAVTPKQYILNLRIQKAKQLLTDTPYTVTAISELCGFSSLYHFCRAFKAKTGMTPTQYTEANKVYQI